MIKKRSEYDERYNAKASQHFGFKFNKTYDADIIAALEAVKASGESMQAFIKDCVRGRLYTEDGLPALQVMTAANLAAGKGAALRLNAKAARLYQLGGVEIYAYKSSGGEDRYAIRTSDRLQLDMDFDYMQDELTNIMDLNDMESAEEELEEAYQYGTEE